MNTHTSGWLRHEKTFQLFKYTIYILLAVDVVLFFLDDWAASSFVFAQGVAFGDIINAFVATIDTAAWVLLLLLFELETWVLDDNQIKGLTKWLLHGIRVVCYAIIIYSFFGYIMHGFDLYVFAAIDSRNVCDLMSTYPSFMTDLDEFSSLTRENCHTLSGGSTLLANADTHILTNTEALNSALTLAWTDIINSGTWLAVVAVLEIDVHLQLAGKHRDKFAKMNTAIKTLLYITLFGVAAFWGYAGSFLDFWDAFLWLVAFIFIELNIFEWQSETLDAEVNL